MKIPLKTPQEIKTIAEGGKKLSSVLAFLVKMAQPGVNLLDLEKKAVELLNKTGGEPGFARVDGYHWATCLNVNDAIVHGVPKDYVLKSGDLLNIDIGLFYKGFNTDMSTTFVVGEKEIKDKKVKRFLEVGRKTLREAIKVAKPGNRIGHISEKIEKMVEGAGYSVARNLTGHGIGVKLHEPPSIPCFLKEKIEKTALIKPGMTVAIEVIYCLGFSDLVLDKDKWTFKTRDGKISAVFEETIAVSKKGTLRLTKLPF